VSTCDSSGDRGSALNVITRLCRGEYATVRQLEQHSYRLLKPLAVTFGAGVLLCLTSLLTVLGAIVCAITGVLLVGLFVWMIQLQKRPRRDLRCPYCTNRNSVFIGVEQFDCDFCERPVRFDEKGTPVPADDSFRSRPTSVYDLPVE